LKWRIGYDSIVIAEGVAASKGNLQMQKSHCRPIPIWVLSMLDKVNNTSNETGCQGAERVAADIGELETATFELVTKM
jgi:hypothetical protein